MKNDLRWRISTCDESIIIGWCLNDLWFVYREVKIKLELWMGVFRAIGTVYSVSTANWIVDWRDCLLGICGEDSNVKGDLRRCSSF